MGHIARGIGNVHVGAVLKQVVKTSNEFATLYDCVIDDDMWGAAARWWPAACILKAGGKVCALLLPCLSGGGDFYW